jgi:Ca-activated chloride channel homolog
VTFGQPLLLLGLVLVPLAVLAYLQNERRRRVAAAAFAAPAVAASVAPHQPGWRRHTPLVIYALALAVLILALAKPQTTVAVDVERASIMLVSDNSGSMQATDVAPSRLLAARAAADKFLAEVPHGIRVGLVAFNQGARTLAAPTTDRAAVRAAIGTLQPSGGTATGEALDTALSGLASQTDESGARLPAAVVLLSDGKSTSGRAPALIAQRAKQLHIPVYTVALGTPTGTIDVTTKSGRTITRPVPPDPEALRLVSTISGGETFAAADQADLSSVYKKLGSRLGKKHEKREITAGFAGGAFGLLAAAGLLSLHWFRRLV